MLEPGASKFSHLFGAPVACNESRTSTGRLDVRWALACAVLFCSRAFSVSTALADNDPNRDVPCVSEQIDVSEAEFRTCFLPVRPDPDHNPDGARQRANKAMLLPCLKDANPALTNAALDAAMDACRPEGPDRH
jgi:hypothetical protein